MKYIKAGITLYIVIMAAIGTEKAISFYIFKQKTTMEIMAKNVVFKAENERMKLQAKIEREKMKKCFNYIEEK